MPEKDIFCQNCRFFCAEEGECRRHAPRPRFSAALAQDSVYLMKDDGDDVNFNRAAWPGVGEFDWCGEFEEAAKDDD